jgi:hypothetical protein
VPFSNLELCTLHPSGLRGKLSRCDAE